MKSLTLFIALSLVFIILTWSSLRRARRASPPRSPQADKCPVCGMFVAKYPDFVDQIVFKDGTHAFFDGVKDMMKYYFDLPKYNPSENQGGYCRHLGD